MELQNLTLKKRAMLEALEKSMGVVSTACKSVGISRQAHYTWLKDDEEYAQAVSEIENVALDFAESKLFKNIGKDKEASIFFYLKTKGKKRGYIERQEIMHDGGITSTLVEWKPAEEKE
jgi:hypothetical protein